MGAVSSPHDPGFGKGLGNPQRQAHPLIWLWLELGFPQSRSAPCRRPAASGSGLERGQALPAGARAGIPPAAKPGRVLGREEAPKAGRGVAHGWRERTRGRRRAAGRQLEGAAPRRADPRHQLQGTGLFRVARASCPPLQARAAARRGKRATTPLSLDVTGLPAAALP